MVAFFDFIKRNSGIVAWVLALTIGILLSQAPIEFRSSISRALIDSVYAPFSSLSAFYHRLSDRRTENLKLKEELIATRLKVEALKEAQRENERLRKALDFSAKLDYYAILAEVVGRGTPRMPGAIVVNAGTEKGVIVGLPVIDDRGVVGKIFSVSDKTSVIQPLNDPNLKISVINARSRAQGIVSSPSGNTLIMENVPVGEDILRGDLIITSGLGGVFPKGLEIGTVKRVIVPQSGIFSGIEITPSARLSTLEEVFIIFPDFGLNAPKNTTVRNSKSKR